MGEKLTKITVDKASPRETDYYLWDTDLTGFGVKICKGGRKSFVCKYRVGSGRKAPTRRMTLGAYNPPAFTVAMARQAAEKVLAQSALGDDPARAKQEAKKEPTVTELCDDYILNGTGSKKASTIATDKGRIERHIKPLLGHRKISDVTKSDIRRFMKQVAEGKTATDEKTGKFGRAIVTGGKGTASRTVGLLGGIFSYAVDDGYLEKTPSTV